MKENNARGSRDFEATADSVFQTLLTITTILSGVYVSITFGWFGQAMFEPHPGEAMTAEMVTTAIVGIFLGLMFIFPLVYVLMAWALSRFRNSAIWRTAAWSGLIYCLAQDFIGLFAMLGFSYIAAGALVDLPLIAAGACVILVPLTLGAWLGYRVGSRYNRDVPEAGKEEESHGSVAALMAFLIVVTQVLLFLILLNSV